jgi:hypothetical protein
MQIITRFMTKATLGLSLLFSLGACVEEVDQSEDSEAWRDVDLDPETIMDLADQERWEDGLEELLDLACDESGCQWVWAEFEDVGLGGLLERLPPVPDGLDGRSITPATDVQINPAKGQLNQLTLKSICCVNPQDFPGDDEPLILVNEVPAWSANNMGRGDCQDINVTLNYANQATVKLFEQDPWTNDFIGSFAVYDYTPKGSHTAPLNGSGASYKIHYDIN